MKGLVSIRIIAGDWGGNYQASSGREAIQMFFRDIAANKIKLCQLSPIGSWHDGSEPIPFRIAPALYRAGRLSLEGLAATLKQADLNFTVTELNALADADAWMLE